MIIHLISFLLLWQTTEVPYRAKEDYQVELKYNFREKPAKDPDHFTFDPDKAKQDGKSGPLPYLIVKVTILNLKESEVRVKCQNNLGRAIFNRKVDKDPTYDIDIGYIDDVKDRITPHTYTVFALSDKRDVLNRIELHVLEDGTFLVNGEKRGKF